MKLVEAIADDVMVVEAYGRLDSTTSKALTLPTRWRCRNWTSTWRY